MTNVAIIGAAGLSGLELIRHLKQHPHVHLHTLTSGKYAGQKVSAVFPEFHTLTHLSFSAHDADLKECQIVFLAIPNAASLERVPQLLDAGIRVIDLSGVYRLPEIPVFEKYYGLKHTSPDLLNEAVFGLPEYFADQISDARLIANPGCYPTGALLGLLPFGEALGNLQGAPIIDAKSGASGAGGRTEDDSTLYIGVNENFRAYKIFGHQHQPEIQYYLQNLTPCSQNIIFTPHLLPVNRGILSTMYLSFKTALEPAQVRHGFECFAQSSSFVQLLPQGAFPDLKTVVHSNRCAVGLAHDESCTNWIVVTAIDNLLKGASGQAIQNMNLMLGLEDSTGLPE